MARRTNNQPAAVLIGNFDGVHLGHHDLIQAARQATGVQRVIVLSFDPHPSVFLRSQDGLPHPGPARLTSFNQRKHHLIEAGADEVIRLAPSPDLLKLTPEAFIENFVLPLNPAAVVEGADFRFGVKRSGGIDTLKALGDGHGFEVIVVPDREITLTDHTVVRASSSITRWLLEHGRVRDAARVLGRDFDLIGTVHRGDQRGRTIGFPTANLQTDHLTPGDGVYACRATLENGETYQAAVNIGDRPTFNTNHRTIEAHLLDAPKDGNAIRSLPEYGWGLTLEFVSRVRDQIKFASLEALQAQLAIDLETTRERLNQPSEITA